MKIHNRSVAPASARSFGAVVGRAPAASFYVFSEFGCRSRARFVAHAKFVCNKIFQIDVTSCRDERVLDAHVPFAAQPTIDWTEFFGAARPVEIEIGCGKGTFLLDYARAHADINVLGMENQPRWVHWIESRLAREPLANARVLCADATFVVTHFVRDASVRAYHVYFPDPWWKRRHHKRRVVTEAFAAQLFRTLEPGGVVHLATDVAARFAAMRSEFARVAFVCRELPTATPEGRPLTNFERKYRAERRPLYYASFTK
jgi:tRNA (guanine-N7-)-methyltransferase